MWWTSEWLPWLHPRDEASTDLTTWSLRHSPALNTAPSSQCYCLIPQPLHALDLGVLVLLICFAGLIFLNKWAAVFPNHCARLLGGGTLQGWMLAQVLLQAFHLKAWYLPEPTVPCDQCDQRMVLLKKRALCCHVPSHRFLTFPLLSLVPLVF